MFESYLCYYINYQQNNEVELLFNTEFAYNKSIYTMTEKILFKIIFEYDLTFYIQILDKMLIKKKKNQIIKDRTKQLNKVSKENKNQ